MTVIARYIDFCRRHTRQLLVALLVLTVAAGVWASGLSVDSDLKRLLPPEAPSVRGVELLEEEYGGTIGRLTVVLEASEVGAGQTTTKGTAGGDIEEDAGKEAAEVGQRLRRLADQLGGELDGLEEIKRVEVKRPVEFFERNRMLYADYTDLVEVRDRLRKRIRWEKQRANPFFVAVEDEEPPPVDVSDLVDKYKEVPGADQAYYVSEDGTMLAFFVYPSFPPENLARVQGLVDGVDSRVQGYLRKHAPDVDYGLTGRYKKRVDLQNMLIRDLGWATMLAGVLLGLFLFWFIRSWLGVALILLPLITGTVWAMAWARLLFASLNLITAFIGVVLLGLGVDYGIHLYSRFHEREQRSGLREGLIQTLETSGKANLFAGLTTLVALGSVMISEFQAFYEFGLIVVGGLGLILLAYGLLFPILVLAVRNRGWSLPEPAATHLAEQIGEHQGNRLSSGKALPLAAVGMVLVGVMTAVGLPELNFVRDFRVLEAASAPSWDLDSRVNEMLGRSQTPAVVLTDSPEQSRRVIDEVKYRRENNPNGETIGEVVWLESLLPDRQDEKIEVLRDIYRAYDELPEGKRSEELAGYFDELKGILERGPVSEAHLPVAVREPFTRNDGSDRTVVLIFPTIDMAHFDRIVDFVGVLRDLPGVDNGTEYDTISNATLLMDIVYYVERDALLMFLISAAGLLLLSFAAFRRLRPVVIQTAVVGGAVLAGFAMIALLGVSLNFLNILILPILLGLGIDATFHILILEREAPTALKPHLATQLAVGGAVLTSMLGLGSTLVARHEGLESLGQVAVIGLGTLLVVNFLFHTVLIGWNTRHEDTD